MVATKAALHMHIQCVHNDKQYKCSLCPNASFTYEALLKQHELKQHNIVHNFK